MKKTLIIIGIVVVLAVIAVFAWIFTAAKPAQAPPPATTTTSTTLPVASSSSPAQIAPGQIPSGQTINIGTGQGEVTVKNFYNEAAAVTQGTALFNSDFRNEDHYQMGYNRLSSQFYITLDTYSLSDAEKYRSVAEQAFLSLLGVSQADACKLNVYLGVNPTYVAAGNYPAGFPQINYGLSFCPGSAGL